MKRRALLLLAFVLFAWTASADDRSHEDDGPIAERLGVVHFPISCDVSVQKPFERGVARLHSFWYEEAERQFEHISGVDPKWAMAHWGVAMSLWHQLWDEPTAATSAARRNWKKRNLFALPRRVSRVTFQRYQPFTCKTWKASLGDDSTIIVDRAAKGGRGDG